MSADESKVTMVLAVGIVHAPLVTHCMQDTVIPDDQVEFDVSTLPCQRDIDLHLQTRLWDGDAPRIYPKYLSNAKTHADFGKEIIRAMGANLLVCLAAWQAQAAQDIIGKIFGIFFPVLAFVSMSFSHVIANMFWVCFPTAISWMAGV